MFIFNPWNTPDWDIFLANTTEGPQNVSVNQTCYQDMIKLIDEGKKIQLSDILPVKVIRNFQEF